MLKGALAGPIRRGLSVPPALATNLPALAFTPKLPRIAGMANDGDYLLGTHDEELARLGLQHRVWRPVVLDCWKNAGITIGKRVLDIGAGPGYAAMDLAELVGPSGQVVALERSAKFAAAAQEACRKCGLHQVRVHRLDLMEDAIAEDEFDFSWCRWVLCFVSDPALLVRKIAGALREGGTAVFHEYVDYATWSFLQPRSFHERFVEVVMESWRASGGEPDIGRELPALLRSSGFAIHSMTPHVFAITPEDEMWQWPASFIKSGTARMEELGQVDAVFAARLRDEFAAAENEPGTVMITPFVMEVIASLRP
jgi:SAM-dependent methyltransferase